MPAHADTATATTVARGLREPTPVVPTPLLSAYDRIGGADTIAALAELFYIRILGRGRLARHIAHLDADGISFLKTRIAAFAEHILDGPGDFDVTILPSLHTDHHIDMRDFRIAAHTFIGCLWDLNAPEHVITATTHRLLALEHDLTATTHRRLAQEHDSTSTAATTADGASTQENASS